MRPASPTQVKKWLTKKAEKYGYPWPPSKAQRGLLAGKLQQAHKDGVDARRLFTRYVWGWDSLKDERVTAAQVGATLDWLLDDRELNPLAVQELAMIVQEIRQELGQLCIDDLYGKEHDA